MPFITINAANLLAVRASIKALGTQTPKAVSRTVKSALTVARHKLRSEAGFRITRPVRWDSDKQRRAFFASNGFGRGIPTGRSGGYQRGWAVTQNGDDFSLENRYPGAMFIGGDAKGRHQSRIHQNRWLLFSTVIDTATDTIRKATMPEVIAQAKRSGWK
jgi:hypothetical protein